MSARPLPVFFLDRNLGSKTVPAALREAGVSVEVADDHFQRDARDEAWLAEVGQRGWYVITLDERIRYRRLEQQAVRDHRVGLFVLVRWKGSTGATMAQALIRAMPKMLRLVARQDRPFIAKVHGDGRVAVWLTF